MDFDSRRQKRLLSTYHSLRPHEQLLMQLCSIIYEPVSHIDLFRCLIKLPDLPLALKSVLSPLKLEPLLNRLRQLKLLTPGLACDPAIVESITRIAVAEGRFPTMAGVVRMVLPGGVLERSRNHSDRDVLVRDLRMAVYHKNVAAVAACRFNMTVRATNWYQQPDPLCQICNRPFDPRWLESLPWPLQSDLLVTILADSYHFLQKDEEALDYVLRDAVLDVMEREGGRDLAYAGIVRLLLKARVGEARALYARFFGGKRPGLLGMMEFLVGNDQAASQAFDACLRERGSRREWKKAYLPDGLEGVFYLLCLLRLQDHDRLNAIAAQLARKKPARKKARHSFQTIHRCFEAIVRTMNGDVENARRILTDLSPASKPFNAFFLILAHYWIDGRLGQEMIDQLSALLIQAREAKVNWLAMEIAELLCQVEAETPIRRNFVNKLKEEAGTRPVVSSVPIEEPWRRDLRVLIQGPLPLKPAGGAVKRMVWLFAYQNGTVELEPKEQKITVKGTWSKGRKVALKKLAGTGPEYLSTEDRRICAALEMTPGYYTEYYRFNQQRLLPALIGHPRLFLKTAPSTRVEVVAGEPEVVVNRDEKRARIELNLAHEYGDDTVTIVAETPTRFKVIELDADQRRIVRTLGKGGLSVPAEAMDLVLQAVAAMASVVTVHSSVGDVGGEVVQTKADSTPNIHLVPEGSGFMVEMFVKPFAENGPYLKPGRGADTVIAEIEGRKLQAHRDLEQERRRAREVLKACPLLGGASNPAHRWTLQGPEECLQLLFDLKALQELGQVIVAWPEGEKLKVSREIGFNRLQLRIHSRADWFGVDGGIRVDDERVMDMKQLLDLLPGARGRFIPLGEGEFLALSRKLQQSLEELDAFAQRRGRELGLHPLAALAVEDLIDQVARLEVDTGWKARLQEIRTGLEWTPEVPGDLEVELRDYQRQGYVWLARLARLGFGACLADDMGLGKTVQSLAVMLQRASLGPSLVVAPTSVCMNWIEEAQRFAPSLRVRLLGSNSRRKVVHSLGDHDLLVCSYGLLLQEAQLLASVPWNTIVLDEAQAIKNVATKRARAAMGLKGSFRIITTGTPIENHLGELWSLFNFINPGLLGTLREFTGRFAVPIEKHRDRAAAQRLKKLIQPFILRRTKAQVLEELPPRTEVMLRVEMEPEEAAFYEALRRRALERLAQDNGPQPQLHVKILSEIMRLRQAACNPRLILPESTIPSAKLRLFSEVLTEILENGHKVLVFSQFVGHLALIRAFLDERGIPYRYLDGSTPPKIRQQEVKAFQDGCGDLFLISLKAGGLGLNLTTADYVIHMDPWWNPAVEDQASDRAHRIGQQRPVTVYRLVVRHTIEEKIVRLHQEKRDLAGNLLAGTDVSGKISAEELLQLIREEI